MFRSTIFALSLTASAAAAQDLDLTEMLATQGLAATEDSLTDDDPATRFALGGVRFLRAVENALQTRYTYNANPDLPFVPVLRLPVPPNPDPEPFFPGVIADIFRQIDTDMSAAREALPAEGNFGVVVDISAIWFDINANGARDAGENLIETFSAALGAPAPDGLEVPQLQIRFDAADAAWLRAYTHLLSGISNLVLAFDPTEVITEVGGSIETMDSLRGDALVQGLFMGPSDAEFADMFAMLYGALNRQPDAKHTRAMRQHMLQMVAENRVFWTGVAQETDNDREWIPNATQSAALGFELPPETGANWLSVLNDAEAVLNGDLLVGHWRITPGAGVNVAKLLENPVPVDIITWFHGHGLVDYMERGTLVDDANLRQFERMFRGDALLFMVLLN